MPAGNRSCRELLGELRELGIPIPLERELWDEGIHPDQWADEDQPQRMLTLAFHASTQLLQNVLWGALASDLSIRPKLRCAVYLLNVRTSVALYPYDDRGMDVVGSNRAALAELYTRHHALLLPYDLAQMQEAFGAFQ